jgi:hypothetical protein
MIRPCRFTAAWGYSVRALEWSASIRDSASTAISKARVDPKLVISHDVLKRNGAWVLFRCNSPFADPLPLDAGRGGRCRHRRDFPVIPHDTILAERYVHHCASTLHLLLHGGFIRYARIVCFHQAHYGKLGRFNDREWVNSSIEVLNALRRQFRFDIDAWMYHAPSTHGGVRANHMSTLETFILHS